jgi:hypothetical protein
VTRLVKAGGKGNLGCQEGAVCVGVGFVPQQAWKFEEKRYRRGACRVLPPEPPFGSVANRRN